MKERLSILLFFLTLSSYSIGKNFITDSLIKQEIYEVEVLEDKSNSLSIDQVISSNNFIQNNGEVVNMGVSSSSFWLKIELFNEISYDDFLLIIEQPMIDEIVLYEVKSDEVLNEKRLAVTEGLSFDEFNDPNYIFDLSPIKKGQGTTLYLKVTSSKLILLPIYLSNSILNKSEVSHRNIIFGLYTGLMLVMILYNLFVFFLVKSSEYLFYIGYIFFIWLAQVTIKGYSVEYIWPNSDWLAINGVTTVSILAGFIGLMFVKEFLRTKEYTPVLDKGVWVICVGFLISLSFQIFDYPRISFQLMQMLTLTGVIYIIALIAVSWYKGSRSARLVLAAWLAVIFSSMLFILKDFGFLEHSFFIEYSVQIGSALETVLLSFALADKINTYRKEKLEAVKDKEKILAEQNVILEKQVIERTSDLQAILDKLKSTQSKLVQSEKMASLGQLTAGMAHEINNPLNYMSQGVEILKEDINDLKGLLDVYNRTQKEPIQEVEQFKKDIQVDYVYQEIDDALVDIKDGISRTLSITSGLKTFSRLNESDFKKINFHVNLDSTLNLMKHEFAQNRIAIIKDYTEETDFVDCNPGTINQLTMNVLANAVYAVNATTDNRDKTIVVKTTVSNGAFVLVIEDNGIGMSEEIKSKLFDPFYTTKDVGEGTGLGMSIVHGIMDNHGGSISVQSELGKGTVFRFQFPKSD